MGEDLSARLTREEGREREKILIWIENCIFFFEPKLMTTDDDWQQRVRLEAAQQRQQRRAQHWPMRSTLSLCFSHSRLPFFSRSLARAPVRFMLFTQCSAALRTFIATRAQQRPCGVLFSFFREFLSGVWIKFIFNIRAAREAQSLLNGSPMKNVSRGARRCFVHRRSEDK